VLFRSLAACVIGTGTCTAASPNSPTYHRNRITWTPSTVGHVFQYQIQRKRGAASSTNPYQPVGTAPTASFIDTEELPNGDFTYRVKSEFDDATPHQFSGWSQPVTVTAVNDAPVANPESYSVLKGTVFNVAAPGVLGNDLDGDSPAGYIARRAQLVTNVAHGTLVLNANGSFTYTPANGYDGPDSFVYKSDDGLWSGAPPVPGVPLSGFSSNVTVSITVRKK